ncbi:MAG TPA: hypothetical protein VL523_01080 [Terriglobia bacterium]|nr:hypothetical protein [Terriglobia bacterium]
MALDELHERRLVTVISVFEDALGRIELLLKGVEQDREPESESHPGPSEVRNIRLAAERIRRRLESAGERFEVRRSRPRWRQKLAAELSTLWVVLENAMPRRMKGYGREFAPQDRADWEALIRDLLADVERMRRAGAQSDDGD